MSPLNGRKSSRRELEAAVVMLRQEVLELNARLGWALSMFDSEVDLGEGHVGSPELKRFLMYLKRKASKLPEERLPILKKNCTSATILVATESK